MGKIPQLSDIIAARTAGTAETREYRTRPLTGEARPPLVLLAGGDKVGKSYAVALASADPRIARTTVVEVGGDRGAMDAYGAIAGARIELVGHDNTWADVSAAIQAAVAQPPIEGGYNILVIDNVTSLWALLSREAQRGGRDIGPGGWSAVNATWDDLLHVLRSHAGPVVLIARVDGDSLVDDTLGKVRTQKDLAYEVDVVVRATGHRMFALTGARSVVLADLGHTGAMELGDLDLAGLLDQLAVAPS